MPPRRKKDPPPPCQVQTRHTAALSVADVTSAIAPPLQAPYLLLAPPATDDTCNVGSLAEDVGNLSKELTSNGDQDGEFTETVDLADVDLADELLDNEAEIEEDEESLGCH